MPPKGSTAKNSKEVEWALVKFWGFMCLLKFQKPCVFVARLRQVGLTLSITYHLVPFLWNLFGMVLIIFFMFATVGISLFGGYTNSTTNTLYQNKLGAAMTTGYAYVNFNDFPNSINMLFVNVVNNNWILFCNFTILSEDDSRTNLKWYFVVFQLITNYVMMNILVGFIIDNITTSFDLVAAETEMADKDGDKVAGSDNIMLSLLGGSKKNASGGDQIDLGESKPAPGGFGLGLSMGLGISAPKVEAGIEMPTLEVEVDAGLEVEVDAEVDVPEVEVEVEVELDAGLEVDAQVEAPEVEVEVEVDLLAGDQE